METSTVEWVKNLPTQRRGGRNYKAKQFVAALQTKPGTWAVYKRQTKRFTGRTVYERAYPGTEWAARSVKGKVVIYARWIGKKTSK